MNGAWKIGGMYATTINHVDYYRCRFDGSTWVMALDSANRIGRIKTRVGEVVLIIADYLAEEMAIGILDGMTVFVWKDDVKKL